ncbi:unnamed protein product [Protopolystoma xenopodis]|uniref:Uncharacterized protein n=1 Tax=Protopolystoma xenopodis TaxID=117903 RepID=A0A448WKY8_9PLAT|nr:unnamed protein product [Protopolystoma xenopodis]
MGDSSTVPLMLNSSNRQLYSFEAEVDGGKGCNDGEEPAVHGMAVPVEKHSKLCDTRDIDFCSRDRRRGSLTDSCYENAHL